MTTAIHDDIIKKVLECKLFSNKEVLKRLLIYLYEKSKQNIQIHEIDIAIDLFKRGEDFIASDDTIVRVNIHKLRIALERYNLEEGKKEEIVPYLPKGSYSLKFVNRNEHYERNNLVSKKWLWALIILVAVFISISFTLFMKFVARSEIYHHPIWKDYAKSNLPVCITLADPFFFRATNQADGRSIIVRDININSTEDLKQDSVHFIKQKGVDFDPLNYSYFSQNNIWPLLDILSGYFIAGKEIHIMPMSGLKAEDIKRYNHIVIGNINSLGIFSNYLEKSSIRVKTNPRRIIIQQENDSLVFGIDENVSGYYLDHAFLVKVPGPDNNIISLMGDFHASGNKGLSNYITDKELLKSLEKLVKEQYKKFPEFFEMVIEVNSYNYENIETRVIYFNALDK